MRAVFRAFLEVARGRELEAYRFEVLQYLLTAPWVDPKGPKPKRPTLPPLLREVTPHGKC